MVGIIQFMRSSNILLERLKILHTSPDFFGIPRKVWFRIFALAPVALVSYVLFLVLAYSVINPTLSAFMASRMFSGETLTHQWVPIERISKHLPTAVIVAEDSHYCKHGGVDWNAVQQAWADYQDNGRPRGASTIPMQTVKNLFLWSGRSYIRKAIEIPLAYTASFFWSKRRMMEIYLNIAEWGPGIYGAEAASRYHFGKSAAYLTSQQAALLAAALPNPIVRNAGRPGPKTRRLGRVIRLRMRAGFRLVGCLKRN